MRLRRREMPPEDFAMTPMIDMVFLLLVFFMCVSSISQANLGVEADLAQSTASVVAEDLGGRVTVTVKADGSLYLGPTPVDAGALADALRREARAGGRKVLVRAEAATPFERVRPVLRAAAEAGMIDIIHATWQQ